jgi:hypothetical protein
MLVPRYNSIFRQFVQRHTGRNYVFELDSEILLDAARVGNETRYLNHAQSPLSNCYAKCCLPHATCVPLALMIISAQRSL